MAGAPDRYAIDLNLDPEGEALAAAVDLTIRAREEATNPEFLLHRRFLIDSVTCDNLLGYHFVVDAPSPYPFAPEAGVLRLHLTRATRPGDEFRIRLSYHGDGLGVTTPWGVNRVTPPWVELGLYTPWFPYRPAGVTFTYRINVHIAEAYRLLGLGRTERHAGTWQVAADSPVQDILLMAAPALLREEHRVGEAVVEVVYPARAEAGAARIVAEMALSILRFYGEWLEDAQPRNVLVVIAPRSEGGAYARQNMIILPAAAGRPASQSAQLRYLAHEIAHLWWMGAPAHSWEDWLNESFAEYSALLAVRSCCGESAFRDLLEAKRRRSAGLPAVKLIDRASGSAHAVLYDKGCILLHDLATAMGEDTFTRLARHLVRARIASTEGFLAALAGLCGADTARWFDEKLSS